MTASPQRWVVDGVAEEVARVEVDGERVVSVPGWLLPTGVREGDVLRVTVERARGRSTITIERDADGTRRARDRAAARAAERDARRADGSGEGGGAVGDIEL